MGKHYMNLAQGLTTAPKTLNTKKDKYLSDGCCITKYGVNIRWFKCTECRLWLHYLCEDIPPNSYFDDDVVCKCSWETCGVFR